MSIIVNIYYSGKDDAAKAYAQEMIDSGLVEQIRQEPGNLQYQYFLPMEEADTVLLIDEWKDQEAIDIHHHLPIMEQIAVLRKKYGLTMRVERFERVEVPQEDEKFIIHNKK